MHGTYLELQKLLRTPPSYPASKLPLYLVPPPTNKDK